MASTGEVGCLGDDFEEAFLKALISVGFKFPIRTVLLSTGTLKDKVAFIEGAKLFESLGIELFCDSGNRGVSESIRHQECGRSLAIGKSFSQCG